MRPSPSHTCFLTAFLLVIGSISMMAMRDHLSPSLNVRLSPLHLPEAERNLAQVLLLLPIAALIACVIRNAIGLPTFGTFAPALLGLAFRETHSWLGLGVLALILFVGWTCRRWVQRLHLLQVPRAAFMLSLVVGMLLLFIMGASYWKISATEFVPLFPLVIITGMIERFWMMEEEENTSLSMKTLFNTLVTAAAIALVVSRETLQNWLMHYPETLGLVMAGQLFLGRYTGYRLLELYRFREFLDSDNYANSPQPSLPTSH